MPPFPNESPNQITKACREAIFFFLDDFSTALTPPAGSIITYSKLPEIIPGPGGIFPGPTT